MKHKIHESTYKSMNSKRMPKDVEYNNMTSHNIRHSLNEFGYFVFFY